MQSDPQETQPPGDEISAEELERLAYATIRGEFGVGEQRKLALGDRYNQVAFEVYRLRTEKKEGRRS